ncbi:MAG TPA: nucleoside triphosphate pyrophosphohydrolase [Clostridia bacterium]|nr:nucleoside triphosphate pyrophosphohydrolase [Clostridia bacterium]
MSVNFKAKDQYRFDDLLQIMEILRGENGCPWDREQDHQSIRVNFIEETYEVIEAIDKQDTELLKEELGDVLLQIVFHSQMEKEEGSFDISGVIDGICKKLIVRHPHVFGDVRADTSDEVLKNWDEIKKQQKKQTTQTEVMKTIPRFQPALMRSSKIQQKAGKAGFDWPDVNGALEKTAEELEELKEAIRSGDHEHCRDELGDLLFSVVNVSRFIHVEPEEALTLCSDRFIRRFSLVEKMALETGNNMKDLTLGQLDELWEQAKRQINAEEQTASGISN